MAIHQRVVLSDATNQVYVFTEYDWQTTLRVFAPDLDTDGFDAPLTISDLRDSVTMPEFDASGCCTYRVLPGYAGDTPATVDLGAVRVVASQQWHDPRVALAATTR